MPVLKEKFKDVLSSVLPIVFINLILHFTLAPLDDGLFRRFLLGSGLIIIGLAIFLMGVDLALLPLGTQLGRIVTKKESIPYLLAVGFVIGFFISAAEPDLLIFADQVSMVTGGSLPQLLVVAVVSVGLGLLMALGLLRIVKNFPIRIMMLICYILIGILAYFASDTYISISFDASGATTGSMSTTFILAVAAGVAMFKGTRTAKQDEDSFGLAGICSAGVILSMLLLGVIMPSGAPTGGGVPESAIQNLTVAAAFLHAFVNSLRVVAIGMAPLIVIYLYYRKSFIGFSAEDHRRLVLGFIYTFLGMALFLCGVDVGFIEAGVSSGYQVASHDSPLLTAVIGFAIGLVVVLAEPAVYTLTRQVESITSGFVQRRVILVALSLGIGLAVSMSLVRILIPSLKLWHFLLPGYALCLLMLRKTPNLFVGIAFDAGGVASGPMTATFVLGFAQGVASATPGADVLMDGFGVIAMVAMMAVIALMILGTIFGIKNKHT